VRSHAGLATVRGDRGRIAQALGNVIANAVEHGGGDVTAVATRSADRVRIEVTNATVPPEATEMDRGRGPETAGGVAPDCGLAHETAADAVADRGRGLEIAADAAADRGRGLEIAADAAAELGGSLSSAIGPRRACTVLDLPIEP
jgi:hypothetical protein